MPDFYKILNVPRTATLIEIKAAYRKLAKQYHPDLNHSNRHEVEPIFKSINHAYQVLSDEKKREEHDNTLGIRNMNWIPKSRPFTPHQPPSGSGARTTYSSGATQHVPPDESVYNSRVWNGWHYGDDAVVINAVRQVQKEQTPMSKQDKYFARMQEKDRKEAQAKREALRKQQQEIVQNAAANLQSRREQRHQSPNAAGKKKKKEDCTIS